MSAACTSCCSRRRRHSGRKGGILTLWPAFVLQTHAAGCSHRCAQLLTRSSAAAIPCAVMQASFLCPFLQTSLVLMPRREARQRDAAAANRDDVQHEDMMTSPRSSCSGDSSTTDVVMGHAFSTRSKSSASIRSEAGAQPGSNRASSPVPMQLHHACSTPAAIQTKFTQPAQVTPGQSAPVPVPVPQQPEPVLISQKASN